MFSAATNAKPKEDGHTDNAMPIYGDGAPEIEKDPRIPEDTILLHEGTIAHLEEVSKAILANCHEDVQWAYTARRTLQAHSFEHALEEIAEAQTGDIDIFEKLWLFFEEPGSSTGAFWSSIFFFFIIILSTIAFCVETVPAYADETDFWFTSETIFIFFFSAEFVIRVFLHHVTARGGKFWRGTLNWFDLLSIIPYYIEIAFRGVKINLRFLRLVRLARVMRIFKLSRRYSGTKVLIQVFRISKASLMVPLFFLFMAIVLLSSLIFFTELEALAFEGGTSRFPSIPFTFWYALVSMTTVGYGEVVPDSPLGKVIGSLTMLFGIFFMAMPLTIIGTNFYTQWERITSDNSRNRARRVVVSIGCDALYVRQRHIGILLSKIEAETQDTLRLLNSLRLFKETKNILKEEEELNGKKKVGADNLSKAFQDSVKSKLMALPPVGDQDVQSVGSSFQTRNAGQGPPPPASFTVVPSDGPYLDGVDDFLPHDDMQGDHPFEQKLREQSQWFHEVNKATVVIELSLFRFGAYILTQISPGENSDAEEEEEAEIEQENDTRYRGFSTEHEFVKKFMHEDEDYFHSLSPTKPKKSHSHTSTAAAFLGVKKKPASTLSSRSSPVSQDPMLDPSLTREDSDAVTVADRDVVFESIE